MQQTMNPTDSIAQYKYITLIAYVYIRPGCRYFWIENTLFHIFIHFITFLLTICENVLKYSILQAGITMPKARKPNYNLFAINFDLTSDVNDVRFLTNEKESLTNRRLLSMKENLKCRWKSHNLCSFYVAYYVRLQEAISRRDILYLGI